MLFYSPARAVDDVLMNVALWKKYSSSLQDHKIKDFSPISNNRPCATDSARQFSTEPVILIFLFYSSKSHTLSNNAWEHCASYS